MKRTPLRRRKPWVRQPYVWKRKKRMRLVSKNKPRATPSALEHLRNVRSLPCSACGSRMNVQAHHKLTQSGRKSSHWQTMSLCGVHHSRNSNESIHSRYSTFVAKWGSEDSLIEKTKAMLRERGLPCEETNV